MKKLTFLALLLFGALGMCQAQSISQFVVGNSGETISGANVTLSFTIGEPVIGTVTNGSSLGQGFLLGAIEGIVLGAEDFSQETAMTVYPNPVGNQLSISFNDIQGEGFDFVLYDVSGRQIFQQKVSSNVSTEQIDLSALTNGTYLIKVIRLQNEQSKTFKIIKN
jgi:hypothetical protein